MLAFWARNGWIEGKAGVPLGTLTLWGVPGGSGEVHTVALLFGAWAAAMVSKTLKVPKL